MEYGGQGKLHPVDHIHEELVKAKKLKEEGEAKVHVVPLPEQPALEKEVLEKEMADLALTEA